MIRPHPWLGGPTAALLACGVASGMLALGVGAAIVRSLAGGLVIAFLTGFFATGIAAVLSTASRPWQVGAPVLLASVPAICIASATFADGTPALGAWMVCGVLIVVAITVLTPFAMLARRLERPSADGHLHVLAWGALASSLGWLMLFPLARAPGVSSPAVAAVCAACVGLLAGICAYVLVETARLEHLIARVRGGRSGALLVRPGGARADELPTLRLCDQASRHVLLHADEHGDAPYRRRRVLHPLARVSAQRRLSPLLSPVLPAVLVLALVVAVLGSLSG